MLELHVRRQSTFAPWSLPPSSFFFGDLYDYNSHWMIPTTTGKSHQIGLFIAKKKKCNLQNVISGPKNFVFGIFQVGRPMSFLAGGTRVCKRPSSLPEPPEAPAMASFLRSAWGFYYGEVIGTLDLQILCLKSTNLR